LIHRRIFASGEKEVVFVVVDGVHNNLDARDTDDLLTDVFIVDIIILCILLDVSAHKSYSTTASLKIMRVSECGETCNVLFLSFGLFWVCCISGLGPIFLYQIST